MYFSELFEKLPIEVLTNNVADHLQLPLFITAENKIKNINQSFEAFLIKHILKKYP